MNALFPRLVLALALSSAYPIAVQAQAPPASGNTPRQQTPQQQAPKLQRVSIVSLEDLPPVYQTKVKDHVAATSKEDLQKMRDAIEHSPEMLSLLKSKGFTSAQVIALNLDSDGILTVFVTTTKI